MKKFRFISVSLCFLLAIGGGLLAKHLADKNPTVAKAADYGETHLVFKESAGANVYLKTTNDNGAPTDGSWTRYYAPVGNEGGFFVNGVDKGEARLKKLGTNNYYLDVRSKVAANSTVTVKGTWALDNDASVTFNVVEVNLFYDGTNWSPKGIIAPLFYKSNNNQNGFYAKTATNNGAPYDGSWGDYYAPVGNAGGCFVDGVDKGAAAIKKINGTEYYIDIGGKVSGPATLTLKGTWTRFEKVSSDPAVYEARSDAIVIPEVSFTWDGTTWAQGEIGGEYDKISMNQIGLGDKEWDTITIDSQAYSDHNLIKSSYVSTNEAKSFAFEFEYECLNADWPASDIKISAGSSGAWSAAGHSIRFLYDHNWHVCKVIEILDDTSLQNSGDIVLALNDGNTHIIEFGAISTGNANEYYVFVKFDGSTKYINVWTLDATPRTNKVGIYYNSDDLAFRNTITTQPLEADEEFKLDPNTASSATALYLKLNKDNGIPGDWGNKGTPYFATNVKKNGSPVSASVGTNNLVKHGQTSYYLDGFTATNGDVITIEGAFKLVYNQTPYLLVVKKSSFAFDGTKWTTVLDAASASDLPADSLLNNIGGWKPDHSGHAIKKFDQTPDTLQYKKVNNDNVGLYFTSSAGAKSEVRFYLPDNAYKAESKGYAIRSVSFDYILTNTNKTAGTENACSLTSDGFYTSVESSTTTPYMIQLMDNTSGWNYGTGKAEMNYFGFNADLIDDGNLHTYTLNVAYSDITGINFCLFTFKGTFFISNLQVDYNAYDADLNELVKTSLKMYGYRDGDPAAENCLSYYAGAKAAYLALSDDQKALFGTDTAYASARARLAAWADANGDVFNAAAGTITAKANMRLFNGKTYDNNTVIIIVTIVSSSVLLFGVLLALKKRRKFEE